LITTTADDETLLAPFRALDRVVVETVQVGGLIQRV